jgi:hypothetical protein
MASLITGAIPTQGFELCRNAIGTIILTELTNQKIIQGGEFPEDINVTAESLTPFDSADQVAMNIVLASSGYSQFTQIDAQGKTIYLVDIYTSGINSGDSAFRRDRFLGMIGYIFRSAYYRMLGLPPGLIGGVYVESFVIGETKKEDSAFTSFAQMQISVRIQEEAQGWPGVALEQNNSTVGLALTARGFQFVFIVHSS